MSGGCQLHRLGERYSNGEYLLKNPTFHLEDSPWKAGQIRRAIIRYGLHPRTVAEIGCGAGEILVQLAREMPDVQFSGYELSPQGYALAATRASERLEYFNTDMLDERREFDLVLCIDVFEHVEDCLGFLRRLRARGRSFLFHVPLDMNVQMVLRSSPLLGVRNSVGHLHYFSKQTALATLEDAGYRVKGWFYTPNGADRPKSRKARLLQLPRKACFAFHGELTARILGGYSLMIWAE